jgi:chromosome segregation ATPase
MEQPILSSQLDDLEQKYLEVQGQVALLHQRLEAQEYDLQERTHRIQELEDALAQAKTQLHRADHLDETLDHLKAEILQYVESRMGRGHPGNPEGSTNLIQQQLDSHTKAINEMRREVEKADRFDDQISSARTESERVYGEIHSLQTRQTEFARQLKEKTRPVALLEDQLRNSARILSELQAALPDLHRKIDANVAKIQLVEQQTPQFTKYEVGLDSIREEIRQYKERTDFQASERERQVKNWNNLVETSERRLKENEALMEKYAKNDQLNKRALASLQDFQERLQRDQHRSTELQRLAEERQRAEMEKFRAGIAQRWQKQEMEFEPHLGGFQKSLDAVQLRVDELSKLGQRLVEQMTMVLRIIEEDIQMRTGAASNWQDRFEELASGQG